MRKADRTHIAITLGDINGIGPEVALKAVALHRWPADQHMVFVGSVAVLEQQAERFGLVEKLLARRSSWSIYDPDPAGKLRWRPGKLDPAASEAAASWIRVAVDGCRLGGFDAMVTAPICKEGFHAAGIQVPGHTEMLAALCKTKRFAMMLFGGPLRVMLVTRHVPLKDVPALITPAALRDAARITAEAMPWFGIRKPRIAVCGLNPHAGEGGDIGREDVEIIAPTLRKLQRQGLPVHGPLPPDTVFHQAAKGEFDAVIAMYHDQGLAPLKLIAFDSGVNVTLGLPIVRTSPDHGTAFAIAGKNKANPASMVQALHYAARFAKSKNPWK